MFFHTSPHVYVEAVHLKVKELATSISFYEKVVRLSILQQEANKVSFTADGQTPLVILEEVEHATPRINRETGLYHFALLLPKRADLGRFFHHLMQTGLPIGAGDHDVSEALYFNDPDGNGIEVYVDRNPDTWKWQDGLVYMGTEQVDGHSLLEEGERKPWDKLPPGTRMGHIHLQVRDLIDSEAFYTKGLGFDVVCRYGDSALFLSTGKYHHHIAINTWASKHGNTPSTQSVGLKEYTIVYPTNQHRNEAKERLTALGYSLETVEDFYCVKDPSGNNIRLLVGDEND